MIRETTILVIELAVLFFGVAFLVDLAQRWLGEARLRRWMGGPPLLSALKGIAVGFITPFCTYSAIPLLIGLRRAGVPPAGYVAFIVAAPVLDPVLFGALILIVGIEAALVYVAVAFSAALALALIAERVGVEGQLKPMVAMAGANQRTLGVPVTTGAGRDQMAVCVGGSCATGDEDTWRGWRPESRDALESSLLLFRSLGPILLLGVAVGLAIEVVVPADVVATVAGEGAGAAIPFAAALGTPLYFNTGLFVPIADSLASVGVGVGAIVALTIAGAGANIPEFVILTRLARVRLLLVFVGYVFSVAMIGGFLAQAMAA
ncbi:MAG: permease [Acidimicrobiia bacterium]|jgi:uncharacterized membrane protein YraQ (UPF0718 family)